MGRRGQKIYCDGTILSQRLPIQIRHSPPIDYWSVASKQWSAEDPSPRLSLCLAPGHPSLLPLHGGWQYGGHGRGPFSQALSLPSPRPPLPSPPSWRLAVWGARASRHNYEMTATPSTAGRPTPPLAQSPTASWRLHRMENGTWVKVFFEAHGGVKRLSLAYQLAPSATTVRAPQRSLKYRRQAGDRRHREVWIERKQNHSQYVFWIL